MGSSADMVYDPVVLNFHESLLRQTDVEILQSTAWLNDTIISFYFEYLERIYFKGCAHLLFVPPQVTQCVKISSVEEAAMVFLAPLKAAQRQFVFFALNDNENAQIAGGTHWSLLVYSRPEARLVHYDSSHGLNHDQAWELGGKLVQALGGPAGATPAEFEEVVCMQQTNGYDCGIHLLCNAERVAQWAVKQGGVLGAPDMVDHAAVTAKRRDIVDLIYSLRQQGYAGQH